VGYQKLGWRLSLDCAFGSSVMVTARFDFKTAEQVIKVLLKKKK